ncbi:MAG: hypothetical protein WA738_03975, partial [Candidatus Angelobacter sp.]
SVVSDSADGSTRLPNLKCKHISRTNRAVLRVNISGVMNLDFCPQCAPAAKKKYGLYSGIRLEEFKYDATQGALGLTIGKETRTQIEPDEWLIVFKLQSKVRFPPGGSHKRFIHRLSVESQLSNSGRTYLAYIANRYRKQWNATDAETEWIIRWGRWIEAAQEKR